MTTFRWSLPTTYESTKTLLEYHFVHRKSKVVDVDYIKRLLRICKRNTSVLFNIESSNLHLNSAA